MLIWLSSYPRSGNTLLRIMLRRFLRVRSWSVYDDKFDIGANREIVRTVGHKQHGLTPADFVKMASESKELFFAKTHNLPDPSWDFPTIYIVRDGRASLVSYYHYTREISKLNLSLEEIVAGKNPFGGSWSNHVTNWLEAPLSKRIILRYEDLVEQTPEVLDTLAWFVRRRLDTSQPKIEFQDLHDKAPTFFRAGSNARNIEELEARCPELFEALHGKVQQRLGYPAATRTALRNPVEAASQAT